MSSDPEILVLELLCRHTNIQMEIQLPRAILCAAETHLTLTPGASAHSRAVDRCNRAGGTAYSSTSLRGHRSQGLHTGNESNQREAEFPVAEVGGRA